MHYDDKPVLRLPFQKMLLWMPVNLAILVGITIFEMLKRIWIRLKKVSHGNVMESMKTEDKAHKGGC